jgi:transcriptional regulator with XRE-family HTH domain
LSTAAVSRRLAGDSPLDINELEEIADFLGVPVTRLIRSREAAAS